MDAGQKLDQRRFTGAVLADDGVDLALFEGEVDCLQGMGRAEALVELVERQDRRPGAAWRASAEVGIVMDRS